MQVKQTTNIKHYFEEAIFPILQQIALTTEPAAALYSNVTEKISFQYITATAEQLFAFTSLQSVQTSLELYSKNEAANIHTFHYQKLYTAIGKPLVDIIVNIRLQANNVVVTDNQGNVISVTYNAIEATQQLQIFVQQMLYRFTQQVKANV